MFKSRDQLFLSATSSSFISKIFIFHVFTILSLWDFGTNSCLSNAIPETTKMQIREDMLESGNLFSLVEFEPLYN